MRSPSAFDLRRRGALLLVGFAAAVASPATAAADVKQECSAAYDHVQALRKGGKLTAAAREVVVCAREACTDFIRVDCAKWVGELAASTPTVVFAVKDASGADTLNVRVSVDGQVLAETLDGKAVAIDPGRHKLRFETAGAEAVEQDVVILQGVKDRRLEVSFKKDAPVQAGPPLAQPAPLTAPLGTRSSGMKIAGIVLTSIASATLVIGIVVAANYSGTGGLYTNGSFQVDGAPGIAGYSLIGASVATAAIGIPLWVIGARATTAAAYPRPGFVVSSLPGPVAKIPALTWAF